MLREAADDAYPLRGRRDGNLALEHRHGIGERADSVPAELHVEVEAAADDVQMIIDQTRQRAPPLKVDDRGLHSGQPHHVFVTADGKKFAIFDSNSVGRRPQPVEGHKQAARQNEIGRRNLAAHDRIAATG
jgi:hypothetical protein